MKKCPECKRTYADDGFTFCLEDGALLSAPYGADEPASTIQSAGPPPTAVIPANDTGGQGLPTVVSSPSSKGAEQPKQQVHGQPESSSRPKPVKYIVIGLVTLALVVGGLGIVGLYVASGSNCPRLVINCSPSGSTTYCELAEDRSHTFNNIDSKPISAALCSRSIFLLQAAALPEGITNVSWSTSTGTIRSNHSQLVIDTSGLTGKTIEVEAKVTSSSWLCSTTVSTSFVVPAGLGPSKF